MVSNKVMWFMELAVESLRKAFKTTSQYGGEALEVLCVSGIKPFLSLRIQVKVTCTHHKREP